MEYILVGKKKLIVERETVTTDPCKIYKHEDGNFYQFINEIDDESNAKKPGFYLLNDEFIIVEYNGKQKAYTEEDVVKEEKKKVDILKNITSNKEKKIPVAVTPPTTSYMNPFTKPSRSRSSTSSDIIQYNIEEDDDDMVRVLKETINDKHITMNDVYMRFGQGKGWNLIYGLRMRHTISLSCFNEWADMLDMEVKITLTDRQ